MSPGTLEALKGSIEKWRRIVEEGDINEGSDNCPLCRLFIGDDCEGCPVAEAAEPECFGTPYWDFQDADTNDSWRADTDEKMIAARAELDFLCSLLPKEESP